MERFEKIINIEFEKIENVSLCIYSKISSKCHKFKMWYCYDL